MVRIGQNQAQRHVKIRTVFVGLGRDLFEISPQIAQRPLVVFGRQKLQTGFDHVPVALQQSDVPAQDFGRGHIGEKKVEGKLVQLFGVNQLVFENQRDFFFERVELAQINVEKRTDEISESGVVHFFEVLAAHPPQFFVIEKRR